MPPARATDPYRAPAGRAAAHTHTHARTLERVGGKGNGGAERHFQRRAELFIKGCPLPVPRAQAHNNCIEESALQVRKHRSATAMKNRAEGELTRYFLRYAAAAAGAKMQYRQLTIFGNGFFL